MSKKKLLNSTTAGNYFLAAPYSKPENGWSRKRSAKTYVPTHSTSVSLEDGLPPPLKIGQAEIIVCSPAKVRGDGYLAMDGSFLDRLELRRALLFWDRIIWPATNGIMISGGAEEEFLEQEGYIHRPLFGISGNVGLAFQRAYLETFNILEDASPGQVCFSECSERLLSSQGGFENGRGVVAKLTGAVPVPSEDVPFEDILSFKRKRYDELACLRIAIGEFYQKWVSSEDQQHQLGLAVARIDEACRDAIKVAEESKLPFKLSSWKMSFSLGGDDIIKGVVGSSLLTGYGLPFTTSALISGALSTISLGTGLGRNNLTHAGAFRYAASIEGDLGRG